MGASVSPQDSMPRPMAKRVARNIGCLISVRPTLAFSCEGRAIREPSRTSGYSPASVDTLFLRDPPLILNRRLVLKRRVKSMLVVEGNVRP